MQAKKLRELINKPGLIRAPGAYDAWSVNGFDDALARAGAYAEAGADVIFLEAPQSVEEMKQLAAEIKKPLLANMVEHGKTPLLSGAELEAIGFKIVIYPVSALYAATKALQELLAMLRQDDTTANFERGRDRLIFRRTDRLSAWLRSTGSSGCP